MVKKKRNYRREILEILEKNNGTVKGFNNLSRLGNFHRGSLKNHLRDLEFSGQIISLHRGTAKMEYVLSNLNSTEHIQQIFPDIIKLQKKLENSKAENKKRISNLILKKLINYYQISELILRMDSGLTFGFSEMKTQLLKICINWLDTQILFCILELTPNEQIKFLKSTFYNKTWKSYLKKHHLVWKKYNIH